MQNSENIDTTNFVQYRNNVTPRYINYNFQNQYIQNNFRNYNYLYSSEEDLKNSKGYYFLTEKNKSYYAPISNDSSISNSIKYYKNFEYPLQTQKTLDTINLNYSVLSNPNNDEINGIYNLTIQNKNNLKNCSKGFINPTKKNNNNIFHKADSNQSKNNIQYYNSINTTSYDKKNIGDNDERIIKIKNNNPLNSMHNRTKSNVLNEKFFRNIEQKKNHNEKFKTFNKDYQTYNNNYTIYALNQRNDDKLNILKANKISFNKKITNNKIDGNETMTQKSALNISKQDYIQNKNDNCISKGKNKIFQIKLLNNKKIHYNKIVSPKSGDINCIKKISMGNISNLNKNNINSNHSFYERKSFSKDILNEKNSQITQGGIIPTKKKEIIIRNSGDKKCLVKFNSKCSVIKSNNSNQQNRNIIKRNNSTKLNNFYKEEFNENKLKKVHLEYNVKNNDKNLNEFNLIKENIDTNSINIICNFKNSIKTLPESINNESKKMNTNSNKINLQNIKNINKIQCSKIIEDENNFKNKNLNQKVIKSTNLKEKINKISINKSKSNIFAFIPKPNNCKNTNLNKSKKIKKVFSKKNLIQLNNINNKFYQEDIEIKENQDNIYKPQISVRLTLFSNKVEKKGKYFYVNVFYSENIKNNPDYEDSDF